LTVTIRFITRQPKHMSIYEFPWIGNIPFKPIPAQHSIAQHCPALPSTAQYCLAMPNIDSILDSFMTLRINSTQHNVF